MRSPLLPRLTMKELHNYFSSFSVKELAEFTHLKPREARIARVERLLEVDPDLKCAYELMHLFREWSEMPWCADKHDSLSRWISLGQRSGVREMKQAAWTLKETVKSF